MITRFCRTILQFMRALGVRTRGVRFEREIILGCGVNVQLGVAQNRRGTITSGPRNRWEQGVILHAHGGAITLGANVYLGPYTVIYGHGGVEIGDHTLVSMHCRILSSNHAVPPPGTIIRSQPDLPRRTKVGRDVWLGAGVTVLGGVTIGDGCVVGAGAVVSKDLPPYSVAMGVPAVVVRQRQ
jgi:acetyltransferase-like isoleucine patch superfamily enzyme